MTQEENLGDKIEQSSKDAQYDSCAKRLLSEKIVLAFILKHSVAEFATYPVEEIERHYIEGVAVAERGLDADSAALSIQSGNAGSAILGQNVESVTKSEGTITYDILFTATVPSTNAPVELIINIEAQKSERSEYELVTRGIYYCARMLSAQKGTVFNKSHYEKLRKVYSIWVCANPRASRRNTMNEYVPTERAIIGDIEVPKKAYDLWSVVIINLGKKEQSQGTLLRFLEVLLSNEREPAEKKDVLRNEFGIDTTSGMDKELNEMCNLSRGIREEAELRGELKGMTKGEEKLAKLINLLLRDDKAAEIPLVAADVQVRNYYYKKYGLA